MKKIKYKVSILTLILMIVAFLKKKCYLIIIYSSGRLFSISPIFDTLNMISSSLPDIFTIVKSICFSEGARSQLRFGRRLALATGKHHPFPTIWVCEILFMLQDATIFNASFSNLINPFPTTYLMQNR